jgi:hypothetical protein
MLSANFASTRRHLAGAVAGLALLGTIGTASATSIAVSADPTTGSFSTVSFGGTDYQVYNLYIPVDAFQLNSGDTVSVHVALTSALTIPSGNQFVGLNFEPRDGTGLGVSVNGTMEFSGGAGAPAGPQAPGFGGSFSNVYGSSGAAFSFTDLVSIALYDFTGGPLTFSQISVSFQVDNPSPTPIPAAFPLLATGLAGLGWLARRRRKRAA